MTHRISYRTYLTGALTAAALMINAPTATAQAAEAQARIRRRDRGGGPGSWTNHRV